MVFWTSGSIRNLIIKTVGEEECRSAVEGHFEVLIRNEISSELQGEISTACIKLAENYKASLHRRLNEIAEDHSKKLSLKLREFEAKSSLWSHDVTKELRDLRSSLIETFRHDLQTAVSQEMSRAEEIIKRNLKAEMIRIVRRHIASIPFEHEHLTNKQAAAAKGVSVREIKRLRRARTR